MGDERRTYWAFLSYSHRDGDFARRLHRALEAYRVPKGVHATRRVRPVFRDRDELPASSDLGARIRDALEGSRALVVVCSPDAARSRWVQAEIAGFRDLGRGDRILAVVPDDRGDGTGPHEPPTFPDALGGEPIAADARPGADGLRGAVRKLVAGILEVDLDRLVQRDRERRRRARRWAALAVLLLAVGVYLGAAHVRGRIESTGREAAHETLRREEARQGLRTARDAALRGDAPGVREAIRPTVEAGPERWEPRLLEFLAERRLAGLVGGPYELPEEPRALGMLSDGRHALFVGERTGTVWLASVPGGALTRIGSDEEVSVSPDGSTVVLGGGVVLDVASGTRRTVDLRADEEGVALDGGRLLVRGALGRAAGELRVVRVADGEVLGRFTLGEGDSGSIVAAGPTAAATWWKRAPDGTTRAVATWFDPADGSVLAETERDANALSSGSLDPQGTRLLTPVPGDLWEVRDREGRTWTAPRDGSLETAHWSPGGGWVLLGANGGVSVRAAATGEEAWSDLAEAFATDRGDRWLAQSDSEGRVRVRELATGAVVAELRDRIGWPDPGEHPHDDLLAFTPDGETLLVAGAGRSVKTWRWREARPEIREIRLPGGGAPRAVVLPDASSAVLLDGRPRLSRADLASGRVEELPVDAAAEGGVGSLAAARGRLVLGTREPEGDPTATVRDAATGARLGALALEPVTLEGPIGTLVRNPQNVRVLASDERIVTVSRDAGVAAIWRADSLARVATARFSTPRPAVEVPDEAGQPPAVLSSSGSALAVVGFDGAVHVHATADGRSLGVLRHPHEGLRWTALDADGRRALSADPSHLLLWDVEKGESVPLLGEEDAVANEAGFAGTSVVAACGDEVVRVWDAATGALRRTLEPRLLAGEEASNLGAWVDLEAESVRTGFVSLAIDPRGRWAAALSDQGAVCLWSLESGEQVVRWRVLPDRTARLLVAPDGGRLVVASSGDALSVIDLR